jgi:hypothetical protein
MIRLPRSSDLVGAASARPGACSSGFPVCRPAEHGLDTLDKKTLRERLGDEVVGAHLETEEFIDLFILGGQKDHRNIGFLAQPAQQFHAVHARHLDIENGKLRRTGQQSIQGGGAIGIGFNTIPFCFERNRNRGKDVAVVVDERDCLHVCRLHHGLAPLGSAPVSPEKPL